MSSKLKMTFIRLKYKVKYGRIKPENRTEISLVGYATFEKGCFQNRTRKKFMPIVCVKRLRHSFVCFTGSVVLSINIEHKFMA